jgi:predicted Zn-dependent protease
VAYHWASRTVGYANPVEENANGNVVRNEQDYKNAFNGSVSSSVWDSPNTVINLTGGTQLRLFYDAYGINGWLGLATISGIRNCVIGSASSKLNDSYLRDTTRYSQTAVDHVACQEVGHTFGLDHNRQAPDTCMNDTLLTAGNRINQHDKDQLASIYANIP